MSKEERDRKREAEGRQEEVTEGGKQQFRYVEVRFFILRTKTPNGLSNTPEDAQAVVRGTVGCRGDRS